MAIDLIATLLLAGLFSKGFFSFKKGGWCHTHTSYVHTPAMIVMLFPPLTTGRGSRRLGRSIHPSTHAFVAFYISDMRARFALPSSSAPTASAKEEERNMANGKHGPCLSTALPGLYAHCHLDAEERARILPNIGDGVNVSARPGLAWLGPGRSDQPTMADHRGPSRQPSVTHSAGGWEQLPKQIPLHRYQSYTQPIHHPTAVAFPGVQRQKPQE